MTAPTLRIQDLKLGFRTWSGLIEVLHGISLHIGKGERVALVGESGSGKSVTARIVLGLLQTLKSARLSGLVEFEGGDLAKLSARERHNLRGTKMSMIFQDPTSSLNPVYTIGTQFREVLARGAPGISSADARAKAVAALDDVAIPEPERVLDSYSFQLSGGMKQRVGLARALASEPTILLMDEAFSALDPLIRTEMQDELVRLQGQHSRTIVFVSHDLDEAMRVGDRICIMQNGRVVQIGTPDEILLAPANDYVRSFFRNVDVSRVFKAGDVARKTQVTIVEGQGESTVAAVERMKELDREFAIVIGRDRTYRGMVSRNSLAETAMGRASTSYRSAYLPQAEAISDSEPLSNVLGQVAGSAWPVPVVDCESRYVGCISKSALLETLDRAS